MAKKDLENLKKTEKAHGTISEDIAEENAIDLEKVTEKVQEIEESAKELKEIPEGEKFKEKRRDFRRGEMSVEEKLDLWNPKTKLGKEVKLKKIKNIDEIIESKTRILEEEIVDSLIPIQSDLLSIGQSKGKFGGGKRRAWRQTQRKTKEGNVPTFSTLAVVGDMNGHVGIGYGRAKETLPARDKAIRKAKLNLIKVSRGDGSFDSVGGGNASIPFKVEGKSGSVRVTFTPAAPGTGLVVGDEIKKVLKLAGIKDIYGRTTGKKRTTFNTIKAAMDALKKTNKEKK